jgi:hypothetical protein
VMFFTDIFHDSNLIDNISTMLYWRLTWVIIID